VTGVVPGRTTDDDRDTDVEPSIYVMVVSLTVSTLPSSCWMVRIRVDMDCCCWLGRERGFSSSSSPDNGAHVGIPEPFDFTLDGDLPLVVGGADMGGLDELEVRGVWVLVVAAAGDGDTFDDLDLVGEPLPGVAGTVKNVVVLTFPGLRATFFLGGDAGEGELAH
jgi:hypothetical protein